MSAIILFEKKQVRRAWSKDEEKWYFAIVDVIAVLTESPNPQVYWRVMKKRLLDEGNQTVTNCNALKMTAADGKQRLKEQRDFAILTAEISKATFGMTPAEYKDFKALANPKENLRDHMTDLELIFTMLGEASTTEIAKKKDAKGFPANKQAAHAGGTIAGNARRELETESGQRVSSKENYKSLPEGKTKTLRKRQPKAD